MLLAEPNLDLPDEIIVRTRLVAGDADTRRTHEAQPHLVRCREIIANGEDWRGLVVVVARAEAIVAAAEEKYEDAEAQFAKAFQIFQRYHVPFEEAEALHYWGRALNNAGEQARANEKLDAAIAITGAAVPVGGGGARRS